MVNSLLPGTLPSPLQSIHSPLLQNREIHLYLKRDDLIHSHVSGNKWRKLRYNLMVAKEEGHHTLLTFGGAYSNHILATAHAGRLGGFDTIGIIRGEAYAPLNPVLAEAQSVGMALHYMPRWRYRQKENQDLLAELTDQFGPYYLLPEGGTNTLAVQGCQEIIDEIQIPFDLICAPCGTGGTLAGLISGLQMGQQALGFGILKGENFLPQQIHTLLGSSSLTTHPQWSISFDYHFGGYAKKTPVLLEFIQSFHAEHGITLDPVYTGKMLFGLMALIQQEHFSSGQTIIAVHTGKGG